MKVFGKGGGAYDSDYMVAIEDAIVLGCDAVNLSLGSSVQGFAYSTSYQATMNKIANSSSNTKTVVSISAGNAYDFAYMLSSDEKELYIDDAVDLVEELPANVVKQARTSTPSAWPLLRTPAWSAPR